MHVFPHKYNISVILHTTYVESSDGFPKWHKERSQPSQWVYTYLQVCSKSTLGHLSRDSKNRGKHEAEWRDQSFLVFEETHTSSVSNCAPWTKELIPRNISAISQEEKNIWPKAVAYLRDAEMLFDALVTTKEVSNFKFEGMQVIEIDIVIDNDSLDTYL